MPLVGRRRVARLLLEVLEDRVVPTLLGNQLFPLDNPWNEKISSAPVAANSAQLVANIGATLALHPDFGQVASPPVGAGLNGIPFNVVSAGQATTNIIIDAYASESDLVPVPLPANPVLEGDLDSGPGPRGSDRHLIVYDKDANKVYELFNTSRPSENADGKWHADQESVWDLAKDSFRPAGWTSADAAGLPILPGLVRPDEVLDQGIITHALRFTVPVTQTAWIYPASHQAGSTTNVNEPRMGERFRLKASVDLSGFPAADRVILQALKDYGMIVADNGGSWFVSGQPSTRWDDSVLGALKTLHGSDFEAVDLTPKVSGLTPTSGSTSGGTVVTITGLNYSGGAGLTKVFFGAVAATSVTVLSDTQIQATAPAHAAGSVAVTVQSGYGTSAAVTAGQFTYNTPSTNGPLFHDDFSSATLGTAWSTKGGSWVQQNGVFSQTSMTDGDPKKAMVTDQTYPSDAIVTARVRVDTWTNSDLARAGIGLYTDPTTGNGYNLVFHSRNGVRRLEFLNDKVAWGNGVDFAFTTGVYYWFKLQMVNGVLSGKVWQDGTTEPAAWTITQSGWAAHAGAPSLNGGSASGGAGATASFDDVTISSSTSTPPAPTAPAAPTGVTATAVSPSQINLAWNASTGASGYQVQRSANGTTGWTTVGSSTTTSFADTGLLASTTYFYQVFATSSAGSSPPSVVVSATTTTSTPPAPGGTTLFHDDFSSATLGTAWATKGGSWSQQNGALSQTSMTDGDPKKAMLTDQTYPTNVSITARVRVDTWVDGDMARAGVGLDTDVTTGNGYNLVFHSRNGVRRLEFLNDKVAWGNGVDFAFTTGVYYWFKLQMVNGVLSGKVWQDGTTEPAAWTITQSGWAAHAGAPALNGGSASGGAGATASFDDVTVSSV
jgi:hypothetical protein